MKGDFSHLHFDPGENLTGVLQQQGRVLLDRDWNDQALITRHRQDQATADVIGAGIAAVPVDAPHGFRVAGAAVVGAGADPRVELQVLPDRIWADGKLCHLPPAPDDPGVAVTRVADYLPPPVDETPGDVASIGAGMRDIVVLEVSEEELNAFQAPARLLEPALGDVDTTERTHLRTAFRLYRAARDESCHEILAALKDDPADKGRLTVQLQPGVTIPGDCPVVGNRGYTGFEHFFYRIEIAAVNAAQPRSFKWSQFNGGLVGRGRLRVTDLGNCITIRANHAAIVNSGLSSFYCEVVVFDATRGVWTPTFGADVSLSGSDLVVGTVRLGAFAAADEVVFFRLWNGIRPIADFTAIPPADLYDGIQMRFDPATATNYAPGDFWTFKVRAGEISNPDVLVANRIPFGPKYHRVPLAEITWGAPGTPPAIEDCRRRFRPLARLDTCCTIRVGDGENSFGDYDSIQAAINALPTDGGMVCILPGVYRENITLANRHNVTLSGCGLRTRLLTPDAGSRGAVITIRGGRNLRVESLAIQAADQGRGIDAAGRNPIVGLAFAEVTVLSKQRAAINVAGARELSIVDCTARMSDVASTESAVVVLADDVRIEGNTIEVAAAAAGGNEFQPGGTAKGGLHLHSLCERVHVVDNLIRGGADRGITLGTLTLFADQDEPAPSGTEPAPEEPDSGSGWTNPLAGLGALRPGAGGPLYDIRIERNRILDMGEEGIGVAGFFELTAVDEFISVVNLSIVGNEIRGCLRRAATPFSTTLRMYAGRGAVTLADVETLVVHDNTIADNGADWLDPVCGVFVLHGEGIDIARNRILNNGAHTDQPVSGARAGHRGGIVVLYALPPAIELEVTSKIKSPVQNGVPALRVHDNIVSHPLGRALTAGGLGPMSIVANQFTAQGVPALQPEHVLDLLAGAVGVLNLGMSNEIYLQLLLFAGASSGQMGGGAPTGAVGLDDFGLGRMLANGQVLFSDNQVNLDLYEYGTSQALTSLLLITLDDLACHDNQLEANLIDDFLLAHAIHLAFSHSATGNRWKEGVANAMVSAFTLTFAMNTTTTNQGTHCILARSFMRTYIVDEHNIVLVHGVPGERPGMCDGFSGFLRALAKPAP